MKRSLKRFPRFGFHGTRLATSYLHAVFVMRLQN